MGEIIEFQYHIDKMRNGESFFRGGGGSSRLELCVESTIVCSKIFLHVLVRAAARTSAYRMLELST